MQAIEDILVCGSIAALGQAVRTRKLSICETIEWYLGRIALLNQAGPTLNCVKDISERAREDAETLDRDLAAGRDFGPLHGIPILVKDNILIADQFSAAAGAKALSAFVPGRTATLVQRLRDAGAIILGKTNMTELADYVAETMPSEFSGNGGVVRNPHGIAYARGQGSSVGSASAVAAGFVPVAIGSETQNSLQTPACHSSVVAFKPSVGIVSRAGMIPLVPSQDSPGPIARSIDDAILVYAAIAGADPQDTLTLQAQLQSDRDSTDARQRLSQLRIGVPRVAMANSEQFAAVMPLFEEALSRLRHAGTKIVDPCDLPSAEQLLEARSCVFRTEFKAAFNAFLREHNSPCGISSLETLIQWNDANPQNIPYGQSLLIAAQQANGLRDPQYLSDRARDIALSRTSGIDAACVRGNVDVLIAPMGAAAKCTGKAGAPAISIPVGLDAAGTPFGITLYTGYGRDHLLMGAARLVEHAIGDRRLPDMST
jgi:amidase